MPAPSRDPLVHQLRELMRHTGASSEVRAASFPALRQLKVVKSAQQTDPSNQQPIRQALYSAAQSLDGVRGNLALPNSEFALAALGLGRWADRGLDLLNRLDELGDEYGIQRSTLRGYQQPVAELLARRLRKLTVEELLPLDEAADPSQVREVLADILWRYRGKVVELHHARRTVRAGAETLTSYTAYITYPNDPGPEVVSIRPFRNCSGGERRQQRTGQFELTVQLPPTPPGTEITFEYEVLFDTTTDDRSYLRHRTRMPAARATVSVQFDPEAMPTQVTPFEGADADFDPPGETDAGSVRVSEKGYVSYVFRQRVDTLFGFGWTWPDEH